MPFDWSEYVGFAEWLVANAANLPSPEAARRSAVSRAYYGAFQSALALLLRKKEYEATGDAKEHGNVQRAYQQHQNAPRRQIGTWLGRLRDRRNRADYEAEMDDPARVAQASVHDARQVLTYLKTQ
jgi:uncharacterized protein (UPF0332 family)